MIDVEGWYRLRVEYGCGKGNSEWFYVNLNQGAYGQECQCRWRSKYDGLSMTGLIDTETGPASPAFDGVGSSKCYSWTDISRIKSAGNQ
ncbi:hypothetical protein D5R40_32855 [Okeania hirsuta]|uniref:Uncharacterized protein n=1 Tax=Okeania hirsuta TaxID=1458930 RepID=A0A3N6P6Q5_9CYAN|nr:hypothetical protein D5R40_32855 [Okeania hirsuta]